MMASDMRFVRKKPLLAVALLGLVGIYCFLMLAFAATNDDYFLWALGGYSLAMVVWAVSYTIRIWRDFFRHRRLVDEETGLRKRDDTRKEKSTIQQVEQDLDVLTAEAKRAAAGDYKDRI